MGVRPARSELSLHVPESPLDLPDKGLVLRQHVLRVTVSLLLILYLSDLSVTVGKVPLKLLDLLGFG